MEKIEILAPAGSFEAVVPAVRMGADAVYLGADRFSARAGAKNFDKEALKQTVDYCHKCGVKVHLTLNTLLSDAELYSAAELVEYACTLPIDALIIQDLGLVRVVKKICPQLPLHGSTQMSVHTPDGARLLYEMGFDRVVLSREMSFKEIEQVVKSCPIETEVFVHGALCMSVSGQCFLSAMLGGRSGNRGRCAQPCRLPFSANGQKGRYDLSLKDMCILDRLKELQNIGVTSAKIEGRMKRPEYVALAVAAAKEGRDNGFVSPELMHSLRNVFSRQGFTDGYFTAKRGSTMFGMRSKDSVVAATESLFAEIRTLYKDEAPRVEIFSDIKISEGKPARLDVRDECGNSVSVSGDVPQKAQKVALSAEKCQKQLEKTGGTPYLCKKVSCNIENGLTMPISGINLMRRQAIEKLDAVREAKAPIQCDIIQYNFEQISRPKPQSQGLRIHCLNAEQVSEEARSADIVYLPVFSDANKVKKLADSGYNMGIELPRALFGRESFIADKLREFKSIGIKDIYVNNLGALYTARKIGFTLHGGFGLNIFNTQAILWAEEAGLADTEVSIELTAQQIKVLGGNIPIGVVGYGYLPLMLTRNCPMKNAGYSCETCKMHGSLTDRKNKSFPLICNGVSTEVLNTVPLFIYERINEFSSLEFTSARFTVENYVENVKNLAIIKNFAHFSGEKTTGLYFRGVQ